MTVYSEQELQEQAVPLLKEHNAEEIHATSDGQFFLQKHFATNHADNKLTVYTFKGEAVDNDEEETPAPLSVAKLADLITTIEDVTVLNDYLTAEQEGPNRVSAVKAIQARIQKLQA
jgi:hypothetical protein